MSEDRNKSKIELRDKGMEDMLGRIPSWITRNGMILFFLMLALLLLGSWVFKYPDVLKARVLVTSVNPPAQLQARTSGKIVRLFVDDRQEVKAGSILAMIENPASYEDVIRLKEGLAFLDTMDVEAVSEDLDELKGVRLGTIQSDYSIFLKAYKDYVEFRRLDYHQRRIVLLQNELGRQREYARSLNERARITEEEYDLAQRQYNRDADLYIESVVSESDMEESRSAMLSRRNKWQEIVSLIAENNISVGRIEEQIVDLELKQQEEQSGSINVLEESWSNLKAAIASWEQSYLLVAPVSGAVSFTRFWSENQNVEAGERVLTIIPADAGSMVGKISLPTSGAGKVEAGNQVNIQFDNYPYLQYGIVRGQVRSISEVPEDDHYMVEVEFPEGLRTYYDNEIDFSQNMQGQAEILTDELRLIERVLNPIRSAVSRQTGM